MINKEDGLLLAAMEDKYIQCQNRNMLTHTGFLDGRQCVLAEEHFRHTKHMLWGGYEDAERCIMIFLPDYWDALPQEEDPLVLLRISIPASSKPLTHRDYLGSVLGLQISRSMTGDIIVSNHGADMIILKSIADFILMNYVQAGRTPVSCAVLPLSELKTSDITVKEKRDTVASLRLDNIVSSAFSLSRGNAQEAIRSGIVFLNNRQCLKPDANVSEGDKIVLRGKGKVILKEAGGLSRKGRICICFDSYIAGSAFRLSVPAEKISVK